MQLEKKTACSHVCLTAILGILAVVIFFITFLSLKSIIEDTFKKNLLSFSKTIETQFSKNVQLSKYKYLSARYDVLTLPTVSWDNIIGELRRKGQDNIFAQGVSFYYAGSASKNLVYDAITHWTPDEKSYAVAERPWYKIARENKDVTITSYYEYITKLLLICFTSAIATADGTDVVLAMDVDAASLVSDLQKYNAKEQRFFITDAQGNVLFHKQKDFEPSPNKFVHISQIDAYKKVQAELREVAENSPLQITDFDGLSYHFVRSVDKDTGFMLYVGMSDREISTPLATVGIISAVLLGSIFLLLFYQIRKNTQRTALYLNEALHEKEVAREETRAKSDFLANMSHEIRTPMNAIYGMTELILRSNINKEVQEYAHNIKNATKALLAIVNDILDFSKIEAGKLEAVPAPYQILTVIHDIKHLALVHIGRKPLELVIHAAPDLPCELVGDEVRIRQILLNLLFNAIKFTPHGTVSLKIWQEHLEQGRILLYFAVKDTGIGISAEDQQKLFSSFYQVNTKRNRKIQGTGLGLAICKRLVDLMGGAIFLRSKPEKGTSFYVKIPQSVSNPKPISSMNNAAQADASPYAWVTPFIAPEANILVVDDNDMNLLVVEGLLKPFQCTVTLAASAEQCLEILNTSSTVFDIIFMDHMMPVMDGMEATSIIRSYKGEYFANVPIVALTANALLGAREMYMGSGFTDFISKPIDVKEFTSLIEKYIPQRLQHKIKHTEA